MYRKTAPGPSLWNITNPPAESFQACGFATNTAGLGFLFSFRAPTKRASDEPNSVPTMSQVQGLRVEFGRSSIMLIAMRRERPASNTAWRNDSIKRNALAAKKTAMQEIQI